MSKRKKNRNHLGWSFVGALLGLSYSLVLADDTPQPGGTPEPETPAPAASTVKKTQPKLKETKKRKGFRGEKEAEGTEAADRFEADTVIKSKYRLNGESLEVDPD